MATGLKLDVFVSPYKPLANALPTWNDRAPATWPATSSSLISGRDEAVLIDALLTRAEAERLATWVCARGKTLTTIYITHGHADHFFGLATMLEAFPSARALALPEVILSAAQQTSPGYMSIWNAFFPNQLADRPALPDAMDSDVVRLEKHEFQAISIGQSDMAATTVLHVPQLGAVIAGDVVYNGIHCWLAQSDSATRSAWLTSLASVASLKPKRVVAGHKRPNSSDEDASALIDATSTYIEDFGKLLPDSHSPEDLYKKMMDLHGNLGNPYTLWAACEGVASQLGKSA